MMSTRKRVLIVVAAMTCVAFTVSCEAAGGGSSQDTEQLLVEKAAGIAFRPVNCPEREEYGGYLCGAAITCYAHFGVKTRDGDAADFYDCEEEQDPSCTSVTGACSYDEKCVVGHGKSMAVDITQSARRERRRLEFSCPYHDEG